MRDVFIGLGSNQGDTLGNLARALRGIEAFDETYLIAVSNAVESEPWGVTDQPLFANAVARVDTAIPADRLLGLLKDLERSLGREPGLRYGPRVIDLDILLFGDDEWDTPELTIPHPRLAEREFAVVPLLEIEPEATWPDGTPITAARAREGRITRVLGPVPGFEEYAPVRDTVAARPAGPAEHGDPGTWVEVASQLFSVRAVGSFSAQLLFDAAVLEQEGIPFGWDPMPPDELHNPWAMPRMYRLRVPPVYAERAKALLAEVHAARPLAEDEPEPAGDDE